MNEDIMKMAQMFLNDRFANMSGMKPLMTYNSSAELEADKIERDKAKELQLKKDKKRKLLQSAKTGVEQLINKKIEQKKIEHDIENKTLSAFADILGIIEKYESDITKLKDEIHFLPEIQQRSKLCNQINIDGWVDARDDNELYVKENWGLEEYLSIMSRTKNSINNTIK